MAPITQSLFNLSDQPNPVNNFVVNRLKIETQIFQTRFKSGVVERESLLSKVDLMWGEAVASHSGFYVVAVHSCSSGKE